MTIARILVPQAKLFPLDYLVPEEIVKGDLVVVPFRNEEIVGIVLETNVESVVKSLKPIIKLFEPRASLSASMLEFIRKAAEYYLAEMGSIAKLVLPVNLAEGLIKTISQEIKETDLHMLSEEQQIALDLIKASKVSVLHGITGSGKTEVYFHLLAEYAKQGKQGLFLLPEIALSKQIMQRFEERFKTSAVVWNASITPVKKRAILRGIITGDIKIVIGARSALFLPYRDLGVIIVDEEHDHSYKQDDNILYNARDMAVLKGHLSNIPVVLGSATPSLESFYNIEMEKYTEVPLTSRFGEAVLPNVIPIDMRKATQKDKWISAKLIDAIRHTLIKGEQVLLFLNRKGYAPLLLCNICGYKVQCSACSSSLVLHKSSGKLVCHHCGYHTKPIDHCPECKSEGSMVACGPGVERIYEEVQLYFPEAKIQLMTRDEMSTPKKSADIIASIMNGEVNIIIGTQIITKGYHFPKLTTVGVIDTDIGLGGGDLRSAERTFQLLYQVGGRAGRENLQGNIYLQTFAPDSNFVKLLQEHDFKGFMSVELESRKAGQMPPITRAAALIISDKDELKVKKLSQNIINLLPKSDHFTILGPVPAMLSRVKSKYRYRILIVADRKQNIQQYIAHAMGRLDPKLLQSIKVDIDPYNFY